MAFGSKKNSNSMSTDNPASAPVTDFHVPGGPDCIVA